MQARPQRSDGTPDAIRTVELAILFTDVVGSTVLAVGMPGRERDEFRREYLGLLRRPIAPYGGREVKNLGDGIMAVFVSIEQAVEASIAIQQSVRRRNLDRTGPAISIRAGVAAGDVVAELGDYYGLPVIEAARLCAAADGGQILAGPSVHGCEDVDARWFEPLGEYVLKGFPEPVPVAEVRWETAAIRDVMPMTSVVELPFPPLLAREPQSPVAGRSVERERLTAAWQAAADGRGGVVVVSGEPGLGKTRLAGELALGVRDTGGLVLAGRCDEDLAVPYRPWAESFDHFLQHVDDYTLHAISERSLRDLAAIVPAARDRVAGSEQAGGAGVSADQFTLFSAALNMLRALANDRPVLLVLDDLHWADRPTLQMLRHVAVHLSEMRVLVVCTIRPTDVDDGTAVGATLAALHGQPGTVLVELGPLSDAAVRAIVAAHGGEDSPAVRRLSHRLARDSAGNPFLVNEMLRHLRDAGALAIDGDGRWSAVREVPGAGLPRSVVDVVVARVARLGPVVAELLAAASVCGSEFLADDVVAMTGRPIDEVLDALDAAERAGIVAGIDGEDVRLAFAHALVQQVLYGHISSRRRARLHRSAAELIESPPRGRRERAEEVARHWLASGPFIDPARASASLRRAGDAALAAHAPDNAVEWYRRVIEIGGDTNDELVARDLLQLGESERRAGDPRFRETLFRAAELAERCGASRVMVLAALANTRSYAVAGQVDEERVALIRRALDRLGSAEEYLMDRARLLAALSNELTYADDDSRDVFAEEAIAAARSSGNPEVLLDAVLGALSALPLHEDPDGRELLVDEAMDLSIGVDDQRRAQALQHRELLCMLRGDMDGAQHAAVEYSGIAARLHQPFLTWTALSMAARLETIRGDFPAAERLAADGLAIGLESGQPDTWSVYGTLLVMIRFMQGRDRELTDAVRQATDEQPTLPVYRSLLALNLVSAGDAAGARAVFDELRADGIRFPRDDTWLIANALASETAYRLGDREAAALLFERLHPYEDLVAVVGIAATGAVAHHLGLLAIAMGELELAERYLEEAVRVHARLGAPYFEANSLLVWSELVAGRDHGRATLLVRRAAALADAHAFGRVSLRAAELSAALRATIS